MVLGLNQATRKVPGRDVTKPNVPLQAPEERNSVSDEHRHARDDESVNEPGLEKSLNGDSAIHVNMPDAARVKPVCDFGRVTGHMLDYRPARDGRERASTEYKNRLLAIRPRLELQYRLESVTPDDKRVDCGHELVIPVRFAATRWQEIEVTIEPSDESVEAGANKHRCFHFWWTALARKLKPRRRFRRPVVDPQSLNP